MYYSVDIPIAKSQRYKFMKMKQIIICIYLTVNLIILNVYQNIIQRFIKLIFEGFCVGLVTFCINYHMWQLYVYLHT